MPDQADSNLAIAVVSFTSPQAVKISVMLDGSLLNGRPMSIRAAPPTFVSPPANPNDAPLPFTEGADNLVWYLLPETDSDSHPKAYLTVSLPRIIKSLRLWWTNTNQSWVCRRFLFWMKTAAKATGNEATPGDEQQTSLKTIIESFAIKSVHGTYLRCPPGLGSKIDLQVEGPQRPYLFTRFMQASGRHLI